MQTQTSLKTSSSLPVKSSKVELIIHARWVLPVIPQDSLLENHSLIVDAGKIVALLPSDQASSRFTSDRIFNLGDHLLMPGLVNTHGHAAMTLLRGYADDHPLHTWLNDYIWPAEGRWVSTDFVRDGTQLAMAEMIKSGTTCFSDMYFFPEQAAQVCLDAKMRSQICFPILDFPTAWGSGPDDYFHKGLALHDKLRGNDLENNQLVKVAFGPHAPYTVSDAPLQKIAILAQELDMPIQIHLHETAFEVEESLKLFKKRPIERLMELEFLSPLTQCVHMTQINARDIEILQQTGAHVLHCPESNLKLASGFCPVDQLLKAGVNVALGTDGAASNNDLDLFSELNTAALLAKAVAHNAAALNAHEALRMVTINGARALGLEEHIGSLEIGKAADVIAIDLNTLAMQPLYNPVSQLVYTHSGHKVSHLWVNGELLLSNGQLQTLDEEEIIAKTKSWQKKLL